MARRLACFPCANRRFAGGSRRGRHQIWTAGACRPRWRPSNMHKSRIALAAAILLAGAAPILAQPAQERRTQVVPENKARYGSAGIDLAARDLTIDPGDNFFRYANGSWLAS